MVCSGLSTLKRIATKCYVSYEYCAAKVHRQKLAVCSKSKEWARKKTQISYASPHFAEILREHFSFSNLTVSKVLWVLLEAYINYDETLLKTRKCKLEDLVFISLKLVRAAYNEPCNKNLSKLPLKRRFCEWVHFSLKAYKLHLPVVQLRSYKLSSRGL